MQCEVSTHCICRRIERFIDESGQPLKNKHSSLPSSPQLIRGDHSAFSLVILFYTSTAMESSQITGEDEQCNSSESGWTMYLASPVHECGDRKADDEGDACSCYALGSPMEDGSSSGSCYGGSRGKEDEQDDDSLASDASTGPARAKSPLRKHAGDVEGEERRQHKAAKDRAPPGEGIEHKGIFCKITASLSKKSSKKEKEADGKSLLSKKSTRIFHRRSTSWQADLF